MQSWGQFLGKKMEPITFTKVNLPFGWLSNMSRYPITFEGKTWLTAEALFQAMRYKHKNIRNAIMQAKSPMAAKMISKSYSDKRILEPQGQQDLQNMEMIIRLKLEQHPELRSELKNTGNRPIIEDCTNRPYGSGMFWGAAFQNGQWNGQNMLGKLWMKLRAEM